MGRRVWSDHEVLALAPQFVLAADEVWRLQRGGAPECLFFRRSVLGSEAISRGTLQGTYVIAPGGQLLGRLNSNQPEAIAKMLESALSLWKQLPAAERALHDPGQAASGLRWEESYPQDGLVLRRTGRDLPLDGDPRHEPAARFNREAVWFSKPEARSLFAQQPALGQRHPLPDLISQRLSCLVLVDNVRGQSLPYHPSEDAGSELHSEVTALSGERVSLRLHGKTAAKALGPWLFEPGTGWAPKVGQQWPHSIFCEVLGSATYDLQAQRFVSFELLALGHCEGRTINNGRPAEGTRAIGFVCELAPANWSIPPTFLNVYDADWVKTPND